MIAREREQVNAMNDEDTSLEDAIELFRQGWRDMLRGDVMTLDEMWQYVEDAPANTQPPIPNTQSLIPTPTHRNTPPA
jgi:exonuclease VII small subunit